jgi:hypothetical protein
MHDAAGRFAQGGLDHGDDRVTIVAPGFATRSVEHVRLAAGATVDLGDIALERGRGVEGRVADERGAAVAGATVTVYQERGAEVTEDGLRGMLAGTRTVRTDRDGRYRVEGLAPAARPWRIEAAHAAHGAPVDRALAIDDGVVDLVIPRAGAIDGSVTRATHTDVGAIVQATPVSDAASHYEAELDAVGGFRFAQLPPGAYALQMKSDPGGAGSRATVVAGARVAVTLTMPDAVSLSR